MLEPSTLVIYVDDVNKSRTFYQAILNINAEMHSTSFASFTFSNGTSLGLKDRKTVHPMPSGYGGGEIAFTVDSTDEVDKLYTEWKQKGIIMPEEPTSLTFGYTFVAFDPDNYCIRVANLKK